MPILLPVHHHHHHKRLQRSSGTSKVAVSGWLLACFFLVYVFYSATHETPRTLALKQHIKDWRPKVLGGGSKQTASSTDSPPPPRLGPMIYAPAPVPVEPASPSVDNALGNRPILENKSKAVFGPWNSFSSLFFFGDSYSATNFDVNGEQPRVGDPFGNHGKDLILRNWPTFITSTHNESLLYSYNFAVGGSTVDRDVVTPYMMGLDYKDEATSFIEHYASEKPKAEWNPETSLFFLFFGVNDIIVPRFRGEEAGPDISKIFDSFHNTTMRLYEAGARKFIFFTVPPAYRSVDLSPAVLLSVAEDIATFNSRVFELKSNLAAALPSATFAVFDAHSFWARVIDKPADFEETRTVSDVAAICKEIWAEGGRANDCTDGEALGAHIWTALHGTYVVHNATAARVVEDCLGPEGKRGYCF